MICRRCGAGIRWAGPALVVSRVTGLGYLAPAVHAATGRESGADGHPATPAVTAVFDTPPALAAA